MDQDANQLVRISDPQVMSTRVIFDMAPERGLVLNTTEYVVPLTNSSIRSHTLPGKLANAGHVVSETY